MIRIRRTLKQLLSQVLDGSLNEESKDSDNSTTFVDTVIFGTLRYPMLPLPQNVDEIMHLMQQYQRQMSYLQEYVYAQYAKTQSIKKPS
jgi:hypothetical protein